MPVEAVGSAVTRLGECPVWSVRDKRVWWVDVLTPALWSHDPATGDTECHDVTARRIGSLALRERGGLVLACHDGLYGYDPETGDQTLLVDPEPCVEGHRKNDGRTDWAGNFWIGTLRERDYAPVGTLYRVAPDRSVSTIATGLAIPNALAFDADRGRVYFADTRAYRIWVCDYDAVTGETSERRLFAETMAPSRPDGSCIDAEGYVWNAEYAGGRLTRYTPSGAIDRQIDLPVSHPTCCCFGGDNLDQLYVTSAVEPLSPGERKAEPLAGHLLMLDVGVRGRPEFLTRL